MPTLPLPLEILRAACQLHGYRFELIDDFSGYLAEVSDGNALFFGGLSYPLNAATSSQVAKDKAFTKLLLNKRGFRVPDGGYFFLDREQRSLRPAGREWDDALRFAKERGYPLFVKPNRLARSQHCRSIDNEEALIEHLRRIAEHDEMALIEEIISDKREYRVFVLDGEIQFALEKKSLTDPDKSEFDYHETLAPRVEAWIRALSEVVKLRVYGVDIFVSDLNDPDSFVILEINAQPTMRRMWQLGRREKIVGIWGEIMRRFFTP